MGLSGWLRRFVGQLGDVPALAQAERVAALVPAGTEYVTVGPVLVLRDAQAFLGGQPGHRPYGRDLGFLPEMDGERQQVALLVLAGRALRVVGPNGERWSREVTQVADLDGHRQAGFVLVTRQGDGLAVTTQSPVQVPPGATWRTIRGMTNLFGGWDQALAPYGVPVHW